MSAIPASQSNTEKKATQQWIDDITKASKSGEWASLDGLTTLDAKLRLCTYLVGTSPTSADIALFAHLHPIFSSLTKEQYYTLPSVTRYISHIQTLPSNTLTAIPIDLSDAPKAERIAEAPKVKKPKAVVDVVAPSSKPAETVPPVALPAVAAADGAAAPAKAKKEKKEKAPKAPAPVAADAGDPIPSMIDLRVGFIVSIGKHPDADGLYVEQVELGEETGPRTIVSGLVNYIPIEQMQNRSVVVVCNLKPANMRGVKSFGMLLCASSKDGKDAGIEIVEPPAGSKPGDRIFFEGEQYQDAIALPQLNPKKKIFETIQPGFTTLDTKEAAWIDPVTKSVHRIVTKNGSCASSTLIGASLS